MSSVVIGLLIRALILLAVAWLAVTVLRRRSASLRALVWTAALAGILVLPVMASVAPTLEVPVWDAKASQGLEGSSVGSGVQVASILLPAGSKEPVARPLSSDAASLDLKVRPRTDEVTMSAASPDAAAEESRSPISWSQVALTLWGCVSLVLAARLGLSHV